MGIMPLSSDALPMFDFTPFPSNTPRLWALVPCAGSGSRAGTAQPKQYQQVAGKPLVAHTLHAFAGVSALARTLVVVAPDDEFFDSFTAEGATFSVANCGGLTRTSSVFNGLTHLLSQGASADDWVLVHDAARCLVTPTQIQALIAACLPDDVGGLLAHKLPDTLKSEGQGEGQGRVASTIDRNDKWLAQTPQMFRIGPLMAAMNVAQRAGFAVTDEASAMEAIGLAPRLVPGSAQNFKVTYPEDFALAEAVILARQRTTSKNLSTLYDYP